MIVFLDTNVLGSVVNPSPKSPDVQAVKQWARAMQNAGHQLIVPAIADYEIRRELYRRQAVQSIAALDQFNREVAGRFLPIEDEALRIAAEEWARVRNSGKPTADPKALDGDVILAGQVLEQQLAEADYVVATDNVDHLSLFVNAQKWQNIAP